VATSLQSEGSGPSEQVISRINVPAGGEPTDALPVQQFNPEPTVGALPATCRAALHAGIDDDPDNDEKESDEDAEPKGLAEPIEPQAQKEENSVPVRLFLHDLALTMGTQAATLLSSLLLTSMLSRWLGPRVLSEYLLLRRVMNWAIAGTLLGVATGLPRYVAHAAGRRNRDEPAYFVAASICMFPTSAMACVLMVIYRDSFAKWFFGDGRETGLVVGLALLLLGFTVHHAVYGYYRGLLDMGRANLLEFCNTALLPLAVVIVMFRREPIGAIISAIGVLMMIIGVLFAVPILLRLRQRMPARTLRTHCVELLQYGVPRVPGEFGSAALTALGPMLAVHYMRIAELSPLLLGLNMLMVTGYAAGPLGVLLLSKVSMMLGQDKHEEVQSRLRLLVAAVMEVSVFTCIQLAVFADVVVRAWVGPGYEDQMGVIRLVLLAIPPYLFFVGLRSTIDAATVKPFNTANVLISLAVYLGLIAGWIVMFPVQSLLMGIAASLLSSQILLALLTARTFRRFYGLGIPWRRLRPSFVAALVLGAAAYAFRRLQSGPISLVEAILTEAALAAIYLVALAKLGSGWVAYTWNVGVCRRIDWPTTAARL
jgi:O-antigen/teichoic acid export membrane protein